MTLTQFSIPLTEKITVHGEYEGNTDSKKAIIFAHGFGVKRDSWGMFNELGDRLKDEYLVVRFDFVEILTKENATKVYPLSIQAKMLEAVISYVKNDLQSTELYIIAHSQGCLVTGLLAPENIRKIALLASPVENSYQRFKQYFGSRKDTELNENGLSRIKRSDGSWTFIEFGFWNDLKTTEPVDLFKKLATKTNLYFVRAMQDHVLTDVEYDEIESTKNITYMELPGDHNFAGDARENWLSTMVSIVKETK